MNAMFLHFDILHKFDRPTHRQTDLQQHIFLLLCIQCATLQ